jgi:hypothetical protein
VSKNRGRESSPSQKGEKEMNIRWVGPIVAVAVFGLIGLGLWVKANYFEDGNYLVTGKAKVDHVVRFEAAGGNIRYYVITPPGPKNAHISCGIAAGENNSSQFCWEKKQ